MSAKKNIGRRNQKSSQTQSLSIAERAAQIRAEKDFENMEVHSLRAFHFHGLMMEDREAGKTEYLPYQFRDILTKHLWMVGGPVGGEQRTVSWFVYCASHKPILDKLGAMITAIRNERRRLSPLEEGHEGVETLVAAVNLLAAARDKFQEALLQSPQQFPQQAYKNPRLSCRWNPSEERAAKRTLRRLLANKDYFLPALKEVFPDEAPELDLIALRMEELTKALWVLHENLEAFVPVSHAERINMLEALECCFYLQVNHHVGFTSYLNHFEQGLEPAHREVLLQSFNADEGSRFDPRRYRWHPEEDDLGFADLEADLALVGQALAQLTSLGQAFAAINALNQALNQCPRSYALAPYRRVNGPVYWPLICWFKFANLPAAVTPKNWPFSE